MADIDTSNILKPKDVKPSLIKRLEAAYGPVDMKNDFFSADLDTYFKTDEINPETNSVQHKIIKLASFGDSLEKMSSAVKALKILMTTDEAEKDQNIKDIARSLKDVFNQYRSHLRKNYPDQYEEIKRQLEEMSTSAAGGSYLTPYAFRLKGSKPNDEAYKELGYKEVKEGIGADLGPGPKASEDGVKDNYYVQAFKYKLVPKDKNGNYVQKGSGLEVKNLFKEEEGQSVKDFHHKRMEGFDRIGDLLGQIQPLLKDAKKETEDYYIKNPKSYAVVYGTDLIVDYLNDIISILKTEE